MAVYTVARYDFGASPAIITKTNNFLKTNSTTHISSDATTSGSIPHWRRVDVSDEENSGAVPAEFPFTSGIYENKRIWTSLEDAQTAVDEVTTWLTANPDCKAFHQGVVVVQVDYNNTTKPEIVEATPPTSE
jgi:hypothetical protein